MASEFEILQQLGRLSWVSLLFKLLVPSVIGK